MGFKLARGEEFVTAVKSPDTRLTITLRKR